MATPPPVSVLLVNYVDDERDMYGDALRAAGFAVQTSNDPIRALNDAFVQQPDVVITRIVQPGFAINGIELTRRLKAHKNTRATLVIITTARIESDYRTAAAAAGCDAYLLLPCLPDAWVAEVRRVLATRPRRDVV